MHDFPDVVWLLRSPVKIPPSKLNTHKILFPNIGDSAAIKHQVRLWDIRFVAYASALQLDPGMGAERDLLNTDHHAGVQAMAAQKAGCRCGALQAKDFFEVKYTGKLRSPYNLPLTRANRNGRSGLRTLNPPVDFGEVMPGEGRFQAQ